MRKTIIMKFYLCLLKVPHRMEDFSAKRMHKIRRCSSKNVESIKFNDYVECSVIMLISSCNFKLQRDRRITVFFPKIISRVRELNELFICFLHQKASLARRRQLKFLWWRCTSYFCRGDTWTQPRKIFITLKFHKEKFESFFFSSIFLTLSSLPHMCMQTLPKSIFHATPQKPNPLLNVT